MVSFVLKGDTREEAYRPILQGKLLVLSPMRRLLIVPLIASLVLAVTVVKIRAASPAKAPTAQEVAQKLLQTRAANHMTAPALEASGAG